jgi:protein involved in polysaccharide export with SLBB domain
MRTAGNRYAVWQFASWLMAAALMSGCASSSISNKRLVRYVPRVNDRSSVPEQYKPSLSPNAGPKEPNPKSRSLKRGDKLVIELRGIPIPEIIRNELDDLGVNLPLIGRIKIDGITTFEAEKLIEKAYIDGGYYTKINVIVTTQEDEYFVQGEVKSEGKYSMTGDRTLVQAITQAGGYTDFAKKSEVKIIRGQGKDKQILYFNCDRIQSLKEKDPLIKSGDIIVVPRRWFL